MERSGKHANVLLCVANGDHTLSLLRPLTLTNIILPQPVIC